MSVGMALLLPGCATSKGPSYAAQQSLKSLVDQKVAKTPNEDHTPLRERQNQVNALASAMDAEVKRFEERVKELTGEANLWGYEAMGMKRIGLAAGIGAAALVVASPANAVWVAALSGFSGGVNGFSAAAETEGYSKGIIAAYVQPIVLELQKEVSDFTLNRARQYMWKEEDREKFADEIDKQAKRVQNVKILNVKLMQPVMASDEVMKNVQATLKAVQERLARPEQGASGNSEPRPQTDSDSNQIPLPQDP